MAEKPIEIFGELKKTAEHPLLVSNAHEQHVVGRIGKFLIPLYAGAVCFIAVSIFSFSVSPEKFTQLLNHKKYNAKYRADLIVMAVKWAGWLEDRFSL